MLPDHCLLHIYRIELQTVKDHAKVAAMDVSKITFGPTDSDAALLLKSLAVQFAFAGECPCTSSRIRNARASMSAVQVQFQLPFVYLLMQGLPTRCTSC